MALIEHLDQDGWREYLAVTFEYVLDALATDRFRSMGSGADDLRGWLTHGGMSRVKEHLNSQMAMRRFPAERITAINQLLDDLVDKHRPSYLDLIARGIISVTDAEWMHVLGVTEDDMVQDLRRIEAGERPFDAWMRERGHSQEQIELVHGLMDRWLLRKGLIKPSATLH